MIPVTRLHSNTAEPTPLESAWVRRHFTPDALLAHRKRIAWAWASVCAYILATLYLLAVFGSLLALLQSGGELVFMLGKMVGFMAVGASGGFLLLWLGTVCDRRKEFYRVLESGRLTPFLSRVVGPPMQPPVVSSAHQSAPTHGR